MRIPRLLQPDWCSLLLVMVVVLLGCGRTTTRGRSASDASSPPDLAVLAGSGPDAPPNLPPPDSAAPDSPAAAFACGALRPLADKGLLTERRTRRVVFSPDRSWIILTVANAPSCVGCPDQLLRVRLPSGDIETLTNRFGKAEPLGPAGAFLYGGANPDGGDLSVVSASASFVLATTACDHLAAPDGSRVYVIRDCEAGGLGSLEVTDVASAQSKLLATRVAKGSLVVSPDGNWIAYIRQDADGGAGIIQLADRTGRSYALSSQPGAHDLAFVSNDLLLFRLGVSHSPIVGRGLGEIRGHVPGSGDSSYPIIANRDTGYYGYEVSADGSLLLGAVSAPGDAGSWGPGQLYAVRLDGSGERLLASDLIPYWMLEMPLRSFAFSATGAYAVYEQDGATGIRAFDLSQGSTTDLSSGYFTLSPVSDRVALVDVRSDRTRYRIRLAALDSGNELWSYTSDGSIGPVAFVPDDRGMVFVAGPASGPQQLRFVSATHPDSVLLAEWTSSILESQSGPRFQPYGVYPLDPTGCFTIADTDLSPGPGTRLLLLPE